MNYIALIVWSIAFLCNILINYFFYNIIDNFPLMIVFFIGFFFIVICGIIYEYNKMVESSW